VGNLLPNPLDSLAFGVSHVYDPKGFSCVCLTVRKTPRSRPIWRKFRGLLDRESFRAIARRSRVYQAGIQKTGTHEAGIEPLNQAITQSPACVTGVLADSSAVLVRQQDQAHELNYGGEQLKDNHTKERPEGVEEKQVIKLKETECPGR
jgi:hypothetical protein